MNVPPRCSARDCMLRKPLALARAPSGGPDAVVLDAQREFRPRDAVIRTSTSLAPRDGRRSTAPRGAPSTARRRCAASVNESIAPSKNVDRLDPQRGCHLGDERDDPPAQALGLELVGRVEGEDRRADPLDGGVEVVDRELDRRATSGSSSIRIVAWSDRPTAKSCWMTVSWRSIAMRSRSSSKHEVAHHARGAGRCRLRHRRRQRAPTTSSSSTSLNVSSVTLVGRGRGCRTPHRAPRPAHPGTSASAGWCGRKAEAVGMLAKVGKTDRSWFTDQEAEDAVALRQARRSRPGCPGRRRR